MAIARLLRRNFVVPSYIRPSRDMLSIGTKVQYSTTRLLRRESSVAPSYSTPVSTKRRSSIYHVLLGFPERAEAISISDGPQI
jgi:hypothetical protein